MESKSLALALGKIPSGIFVVTMKSKTSPAALLVSWVQQAAFVPPMVTVAINKDRPINPFFAADALFGLNILSKDDTDLYSHFVKGLPPEQVFGGVKVRENSLGVPLLQDAMATLTCKIINRMDSGDHHLILSEVLSGALLCEDENPRVHIRKNGLRY